MTVSFGGSTQPLSALAAGVALVAAAACATTTDLREARGTGAVRTFEGAFDEVFTAAIESLRGLGMTVDRAHQGERWIAATRRPGELGPGAPEEAVSIQSDQGERIGVFFDSVAPERWEVEVVTVRLFKLDPSRLDWAEEVFFSMEMRLDPEGRIRLPSSDPP